MSTVNVLEDLLDDKLNLELQTFKIRSNPIPLRKKLFDYSNNTTSMDGKDNSSLMILIDSLRLGLIDQYTENKKLGYSRKKNIKNLIDRESTGQSYLQNAASLEHLLDLTLEAYETIFISSADNFRERNYHKSAFLQIKDLIDILDTTNEITLQLHQTNKKIGYFVNFFKSMKKIANLSDDNFVSALFSNYSGRIANNIGKIILKSKRHPQTDAIDWITTAAELKKNSADNYLKANLLFEAGKAYDFSGKAYFEAANMERNEVQKIILYNKSIKLREKAIDSFSSIDYQSENLAINHSYVGRSISLINKILLKNTIDTAISDNQQREYFEIINFNIKRIIYHRSEAGKKYAQINNKKEAFVNFKIASESSLYLFNHYASTKKEQMQNLAKASAFNQRALDNANSSVEDSKYDQLLKVHNFINDYIDKSCKEMQELFEKEKSKIYAQNKT